MAIRRDCNEPALAAAHRQGTAGDHHGSGTALPDRQRSPTEKNMRNIQTDRCQAAAASSQPDVHPATNEVGRLAIHLKQTEDDNFDDNTAALQFWNVTGDDMIYAGLGCEIGVNVGQPDLEEADRLVQIPFRSISVYYGENIGTIVYEPKETIKKTFSIGCFGCSMSEER